MTPQDHAVCASFFRERGFDAIQDIIKLKRELHANEWFMHPDGIENLKDEIVARCQDAYRAFKQAQRDEQAAVRRAA